MSSYLPEKTYIVCTNQLGSEYRQLVADSDKRNVSVFYQENRAFLTIIDKKINEDFTCKTGWSKGLNTGAFGVGLGVALGMAAAAATVPIVGWIVGGLIALVAIGYALYKIFTNPRCTGALGNEASQWKLYHHKVSYNKYNAVLGCSILQCGEGGILLPFISQTAATKAAGTIGWNNKGNIGFSAIASALNGYGVGYLLGKLDVTTLGVAVCIGKYIVSPSAEWVGEKYAEYYGGKRYEDIKTAIEDTTEPEAGPLDDLMGASDPANDINDIIENKNKIVEAMKANGASKKAIANFEKSVAEAKKTGTLSNPESKKVLSDIKSGKYGSDVKNIFTNRKGNTRGMHTQKNYDKAAKMEKNKISLNRQTSVKSIGKGVGGTITIVQPFVSAILDRRALVKAIKIQEAADAERFSNSISVVSIDY